MHNIRQKRIEQDRQKLAPLLFTCRKLGLGMIM